MFKIAVLLSGNGSNLQAIVENIKSGALNCSIECVISDRPEAYGLERAKAYGITSCLIDRKIHGERLSDEILSLLNGKVDLIILAGFLSILRGDIISVFKNKIINIHPSLIPSFCGSGMYGCKVHKQAIETGVKVSGCTVHFVDEETDGGPIILQKTVPVYCEDNVHSLQKRVLTEEHKALTEAIRLISEDRVRVSGKKVQIEN